MATLESLGYRKVLETDDRILWHIDWPFHMRQLTIQKKQKAFKLIEGVMSYINGEYAYSIGTVPFEDLTLEEQVAIALAIEGEQV